MFSNTSLKVPLPQHFTCSTCWPVDACAVVVNEAGSIVSPPLSIEYAIETVGTEAHVCALAVTINGEVTVAPFVGLETVMAPSCEVQPARAKAATNSKDFMGYP